MKEINIKCRVNHLTDKMQLVQSYLEMGEFLKATIACREASQDLRDVKRALELMQQDSRDP